VLNVPPDTSVTFAAFMVGLGLIVVGTLSYVSYEIYTSIIHAAERDEEERLANAAAAERRKQQLQEACRQGELLQARRSEEMEAARARRRELREAREERRSRPAEEFQTSILAGTLQEIDRRLRQEQLLFSRSGRVLRVRVVAVPTGWVGIEWVLDAGLPQPLRVVGEKDGLVVFTEHAYRGLYVDTLERGRSYLFQFHAFDGSRVREPDFKMVITIPTPAQYARNIEAPAAKKPEQAAARKRRITKKAKMIMAEDALWESVRQQGHATIDASNGSDLEKRKRKSFLDAKLAREREKEEDEQENESGSS